MDLYCLIKIRSKLNIGLTLLLLDVACCTGGCINARGGSKFLITICGPNMSYPIGQC